MTLQNLFLSHRDTLLCLMIDSASVVSTFEDILLALSAMGYSMPHARSDEGVPFHLEMAKSWPVLRAGLFVILLRFF